MGIFSNIFRGARSGEAPQVPAPQGAMPRERMGRESISSPQKRMALSEPFGMPYDGAGYFGQEVRDWYPLPWSPDSVIGWQRETLVSRSRDLVRNDGWAAGAIIRACDSTLGVNFRPLSRPDWRQLRRLSGNPAYDQVWAEEFAQATDAHWRLWANDIGHHNDAERQMTFGEQMFLAFRQLLVDGDAFAILPWLEDRIGFGRARYATCCQLIDTIRLSNPDALPDAEDLRQGVEIDPKTGAPIAYHVQQGEYADIWAGAGQFTWKRYPRETDWGRPVCVHIFDAQLPGQHRGGAGIFAPVITALKKLFKYDEATLKTAILNSTFGFFLRTPNDPQMFAEALQVENGANSLFGPQWEERYNFNKGRQLSIQNNPIPMLAPGEEIQTVAQTNPHSEYDPFVKAVLRRVAQASGLSTMQLTGDWSDVNYSSARAAIIEAKMTADRRLKQFEVHFAEPIRQAWLEEAFYAGDLPLPQDALPFEMARGAYGNAKWLGPAKGWVDPVKEIQGVDLRLRAGLSTLSAECANQEGQDWEEIADQQAAEMRRRKELGLPPASWMPQEPDAAEGPDPETQQRETEENDKK